MKNIGIYAKALILMMVMGLWACNSSDDDVEVQPPTEEEGDEPTEEEATEPSVVEALFLPRSDSYETAVPRLMVHADGCYFMQQITPGHPEVETWLMADSASQYTFLVLATDSMALMAACPRYDGAPRNDVLLARRQEDGMYLAAYHLYDWERWDATSLVDVFIEDTVTTRSSYGDLDFAARETDKLIMDMGKEAGKFSDLAGVLDIKAVQHVTSVFSVVGLTSARYMLWEDDPEMLEEVREQLVKDATQSFLVSLMPSTLQRMWHGANLFSLFDGNWWENVGFQTADADLPAEDPEDGIHQRVRSLSQIASSSGTLFSGFQEMQPKFRLQVKVSDVGETQATLSGSCRINEGSETSVWQMGYILTEPTGERVIDAWDMQPMTLTNLQMGTDYQVVAFVTSAFGKCLSSPVSFTTDGKLEVYPEEVTFKPEGGTRGVAVTVGPGMKWAVTDMPAWCTLSGQADGSFFVKAGPAEEARSGSIEITATLANGKTRTATVQVSQEAKPVVITGSGTVMFMGTMYMETDYKYWRDDVVTKDETEKEETSGVVTVTIKDGKYYLGGSLGAWISYTDWEVGSQHPLPNFVEYRFGSYDSLRQSYTQSSITISGECSGFSDYSYNAYALTDYGLSFTLSITGLDTASPRLTSTCKYTWNRTYDYRKLHNPYLGDPEPPFTGRDYKEERYMQTLTGSKLPYL